MKLLRYLGGSVLLFLGLAQIASAHEAYVVPRDYFWQQLATPFSAHALDALRNPNNVRITLEVVIGVLALLAANYFFRESAWGRRFHQAIERLAPYGPLFVRAAIAAAFFYSALSWSFLGPELVLQQMPWPAVMRGVLFLCSGLIALGFLTEFAGLLALVLFTIGFFVFGLYLMTYLNYLGEIIVLLLFGMRKWSLDGLLFGPRKLFSTWEQYGTSIVRVFYGLALSYAAVNVKFLHPDLTVRVVTDWHLTQFHWLFPSDPLLVVLGAGLSELAIGLFIIFGFEMRLTVAISLFYITLSLLYFRELVWPHLMLYGISLNLIVQPEVFTVDHLLFKERRAGWWKRPWLPHRRVGQVDGGSGPAAV
ncbi:MAG: hypothetical protein KGI60_04770 [Patescibacteria group bacterium]|nr:hypothetical protein [Patescibacteria group bacterium]